MVVMHTLVPDNSFHILRAEVQSLLEKGTVEKLPMERSESGF